MSSPPIHKPNSEWHTPQRERVQTLKLQIVVKKSIDLFVLEEDGDSKHRDSSKQNIVRQWKDSNGLISYFNCPGSPDLAPIENCWQAPKQML